MPFPSISVRTITRGIRAVGGFLGQRLDKLADRWERSGDAKGAMQPERAEKEARAEHNAQLEVHRQAQAKEQLSRQKRFSRARARRKERTRAMDERRRVGARGKHRGDLIDFFNPQKVGLYEKEKRAIEADMRSFTGDPNHITEDYLNEKAEYYRDKNELDKYEAFCRLRDEHRAISQKLERAIAAQAASTEWQNWDPGDVPKKSARRRVVEQMRDLALGNADKVPVIGGVLSMIVGGYSQLKVSIDEVTDAAVNVAAGTREMSSIGRIVGTVVGAVVGAAIVGALFALIGSAVPIFGTAVAGTTGIVMGALLGASIGGPLGAKAFNAIAQKIPSLREERDYQMEYSDLKRLRKLYGFDEGKILKMHSYLSNQIKLLGENESTSLRKLRRTALEEGREKSLMILCRYFLSQEKLLRSGLYDVAAENLKNQAQRTQHLKHSMALLKETPDLPDRILLIQQEKRALKELLRQNEQALVQYETPVSKVGQVFPTEKEIALREENAKLRIAIREIYGTGVEKEWHVLQKALARNKEEADKIANKQFEMTRERDAVVEMLEEFKYPSEIYREQDGKIKPISVYNNMLEFKKEDGSRVLAEDEIGKLFQHDKVRQPVDVRSFGEEEGYPYAIHRGDSVLAQERDAFISDMQENFLQYAQDMAHRTTIVEISLEKKKEKMIGIQSLTLLQSATEQAKMLSEAVKNASPKDATALNIHINNNIFALRKAGALFEKERLGEFQEQLSAQEYVNVQKDIEHNIQCLENISHFLQYAPLSVQDKKSLLGVPADSPVRDVTPFTVLDNISQSNRRHAWAPGRSSKRSSVPPLLSSHGNDQNVNGRPKSKK